MPVVPKAIPDLSAAPRVAGLLPYHPPRFVSTAVGAAEALPPSIKSQSLRNALLRGGAKPDELDYAGLDAFLADRQGQPVSRQEVVDFLNTEGPLGQLRRVEQRARAEGEPRGDWTEHFPYPGRAENIRAPFSEEGAYPYTRYRSFTVPGKRGDFTGYREVLIEDPKNRPSGNSMELQPGQRASEDAPVYDAHAADYWVRYNEYPDRIAVQNIQSDVGQAAADVASENKKRAALQAEIDAAEQEVSRIMAAGGLTQWDDLDNLPEAMQAAYLDAMDRRGRAIQELMQLPQQGRVSHLSRAEAQQIVDAHDPRMPHPDYNNARRIIAGDALASDDPSPLSHYSPLAQGDNWKNLMARHIALQSIAGGGKPITLPTGDQMVDVEGFGLGTHSGNPFMAAKAADSYNEDLVRRIQKIFRGLHPAGADAARAHAAVLPPEKATIPLPTPEDPNMWARHYVHQDLLPPIRERATRAMELADSNPDIWIWADQEDGTNPYGFFDPTVHEELVRIASESPNAEARQNALEAVGLWRRAGELSHSEKQARLPPGWTIKPSPEAVRAALERGLPIMSLAPLLLAPSRENAHAD